MEIIELIKGVLICLHGKGGGIKDTQRNTQNSLLNIDLFQNIISLYNENIG